MGIKTLLYRCQPAQLYIVLVLSICYFTVQMALSYITHALTLLMASYHMLCNIFALAGCIVTIKHSNYDKTRSSGHANSSNSTIHSEPNNDKIIVLSLEEQSLAKRERREMKLRNTFGWTRIDVLTMLIVCIILASLSFSLFVEALQTLVHIDHQDAMHLPIIVMILGFVGLVLNGVTYLLIGGYTMHQGSFLHVTPSGDVVLDRAMSNSGDLKLKLDERQLSKTKNDQHLHDELKSDLGRLHYAPKRQGAVEMLRDISSTIFVIVCSIIVYMAQDEEHTAKFIDPILSIFSCVLLVSLSYPYMKESCLILLQTIPGSIDMEIFERTLVTKFPEIVSYHDLHIWQLTAHKYVATVHVKFPNPKIYTKIIDDVRAYFHEQGINEVTIQPEFHCARAATASLECLVQCTAVECAEKVCCKDSRSDLREVSVCPSGGNAAPCGHTVSMKNVASALPASHSKPLELSITTLLKFKTNLVRSQSANQLDSASVVRHSDDATTELRGVGGVLKKTESAMQVMQCGETTTTAALKVQPVDSNLKTTTTTTMLPAGDECV